MKQSKWLILLIGTVLFSMLGRPSTAEARKIAVNIESTPSGATVYLDSADGTPLGTTPMSRVRIERGNHTLIFKLNGYEDFTMPVNIRRWRETFRAELKPYATMRVTAGSTDSQGAEVRIDGVLAGTIPVEKMVKPGRHLIQVTKEGFESYSEWTTLQGGAVFSLPVLLKKAEPDTGSILVSSDISGATVLVDGSEKGQTPTVIEDLSVGNHVIELRTTTQGVEPSLTREVMVLAGKRAVVTMNFRDNPTGSIVRVLCDTPNCQVTVDGELIGAAPAETRVMAGEHIVGASAPGYQTVTQNIVVESGKQKVVSMTLTGSPGRIVVHSSAPNATVLINGQEKGTAPFVLDEAEPGTYSIVVRADGFQEFSQTCRVGPKDCEIKAELETIKSTVRVVADAPDAEFLLDGKLIGSLPWEGQLPVGLHKLEIRAPGRRPFIKDINIAKQNSLKLVDVELLGETELTEEEKRQREAELARVASRSMARAGHPLPDGIALVDFSVGWPYLFEGRMAIGLLDYFEVGFALRTFFRLTEFEGRFKFGIRPIEQISLGAQARIGGGLGPTRGDESGEEHPTNDFLFILEGIGTVHFGAAGSVSIWGAFDFYSDRWDWQGIDGGQLYRDEDGNFSRQNTARFRMGGSIEIILNDHWNVWGSFEGAFGDRRRILGDILSLGNEDVQLYTRAGFTYKFGM